MFTPLHWMPNAKQCASSLESVRERFNLQRHFKNTGIMFIMSTMLEPSINQVFLPKPCPSTFGTELQFHVVHPAFQCTQQEEQNKGTVYPSLTSYLMSLASL